MPITPPSLPPPPSTPLACIPRMYTSHHLPHYPHPHYPHPHPNSHLHPQDVRPIQILQLPLDALFNPTVQFLSRQRGRALWV